MGLHTLLGYAESFSARYYCCFCLADKDDCQTVFTDDDLDLLLRNQVLHAQHCSDIQDTTVQSSFGVRRTCILNDLQYFNVSGNFAIDNMHDILDGVGQFELKLLFGYLSDKIISKQDIFERVYAYSYGYLELKNRPSRINMEQTGNGIGLNAIQTFCLICNVPLIFGDIVAEGNAHWKLLLQLFQMINIVFSPVITEGMTICLKHLVTDHHQLFKELYPLNLIPNHHFMVHYARAIRRIGPILHFWGTKHSFFKNTVKNVKNITKSVSKKHQMAIAKATLMHKLT